MHEYWLADAASVVIEYILPIITALLQSEATAEQIANSKGITSLSSHDHHTAYSATARNGGISNNNTHAVSTLSLTSSNGMMMRKLPAAFRSVLPHAFLYKHIYLCAVHIGHAHNACTCTRVGL
jgi:hypothetical protein